MAIYGNLTHNTVDISVLENNFNNEFNNFNRIMESINVLNESGIVLEKVSMEVVIKKFKEIFDKFKKFVYELLKKIKELIFKKNKSSNSSNNSTTSDRMNEIIKYKKYEIKNIFFTFDKYLSNYENYLCLPLSGNKIDLDFYNLDNLNKFMNDNEQIKENKKKAFLNFYEFAYNALKIEFEEVEDTRSNVINYYKSLESKIDNSRKDVYKTLEKMSNQSISALKNFLNEMEKSEDNMLVSRLSQIAFQDISYLKTIIMFGQRHINKCQEILQVASAYTIPY